MLTINPLLKSSTLLPSSAATAFYKTVPKDLKPASSAAIENIPVYSIVEAQGSGEGEKGGTWRGGWSKRFIPDEIVYETSMQATENGMSAITHAPMGVHSVTTWVIREAKEEDAENGESGLVLEKTGAVTSNRMLMGFIKTTLQESYDKLAKDFVTLLQKEVAKKRGGAEVEKAAVLEQPGQPAGEQQVEVEAVA
jgi:hypothetical protein